MLFRLNNLFNDLSKIHTEEPGVLSTRNDQEGEPQHRHLELGRSALRTSHRKTPLQATNQQEHFPKNKKVQINYRKGFHLSERISGEVARGRTRGAVDLKQAVNHW